MGFSDACSRCGGSPFHKLGCPVITIVTRTSTLVFGALTVGLVILAMVGGPIGSIALGIALTLFFAGYWFLSSRLARARRP